MDLQASRGTAATLGALAFILVVASLWAYHAVTRPFPTHAVAATPICQAVPVAAGKTIQTGQVLVNVLNAGTKVGLAQSTQARLAAFGFAVGERGNTAHVRKHLSAEVWTDGPKGAATRLVASYLGRGVRVIRRYSSYPGITVVVGDRFGKVHAGLRSAKAIANTTVCEPTAAGTGY